MILVFSFKDIVVFHDVYEYMQIISNTSYSSIYRSHKQSKLNLLVDPTSIFPSVRSTSNRCRNLHAALFSTPVAVDRPSLRPQNILLHRNFPRRSVHCRCCCRFCCSHLVVHSGDWPLQKATRRTGW